MTPRAGDILFLYLGSAPVRVGEVVVFSIAGRDIPIVHRVIKVHDRAGSDMQEILTKGDNNFGDDKARPAAEPAGSAARRGCAARCLRQFWKARTAAQGAVPAAAGAVCGGAGLAEQGAHHGPGGASPPSSCWACPTAAVLLCAVLRLHWASAGHSAGHAAWPEGAPACPRLGRWAISRMWGGSPS